MKVAGSESEQSVDGRMTCDYRLKAEGPSVHGSRVHCSAMFLCYTHNIAFFILECDRYFATRNLRGRATSEQQECQVFAQSGAFNLDLVIVTFP